MTEKEARALCRNTGQKFPEHTKRTTIPGKASKAPNLGESLFLQAWRAHTPCRHYSDPIHGLDGGQQVQLGESRRKFDFAWPEHKVAVEINGTIHMLLRERDGQGAYVRGGWTAPNVEKIHQDYAKLNLAQIEGWIMLVTTPDKLEVDPWSFLNMLLIALKRREDALR